MFYLDCLGATRESFPCAVAIDDILFLSHFSLAISLLLFTILVCVIRSSADATKLASEVNLCRTILSEGMAA